MSLILKNGFKALVFVGVSGSGVGQWLSAKSGRVNPISVSMVLVGVSNTIEQGVVIFQGLSINDSTRNISLMLKTPL